jgi:hypothetical protein
MPTPHRRCYKGWVRPSGKPGDTVKIFRHTMATLVACACCAAQAQAQVQDYAAWKSVNKNGQWTLAAEKAVRATSLPMLTPRDIGTFCPSYELLAKDDRVRFWVGLLSAMAKPESGFKPETTYVEPDILDANKQNVVSRGLLQISQESANLKPYGCGIKQATDLHKVDVNLNCAARIMRHWVDKDGLIAAASKPAVGAARYWSVLRAWRGHLSGIGAYTKSLDVCRS